MKRITIITLVSVLVLIVGAFIWVALNINSLIIPATPQIERALSEALGTSVKLGQITTELFPSINLRVHNTSIGVSQNSSGLAIGDLRLRPKILPLLSRKIEISSLEINAPQITLEQVGGKWGIAGLAQLKKNKTSDKAAPDPSSKHTNTNAKLPSPFQVNLENFAIQDLNIRLKAGKQDVDLATITSTGTMALAAGKLSISSDDTSAQVLDSGRLNSVWNIDNTTPTAPFSAKLNVANFDLTKIKNLLGLIDVSFPIETSGTFSSKLSADGTFDSFKANLDIDFSDSQIGKSGQFEKLANIPTRVVGNAYLKKFNILDAGTFDISIREAKVTALTAPLTEIHSTVKLSKLVLTPLSGRTESTIKFKLGSEPIDIDLNTHIAEGKTEITPLNISGFDGKLSLNTTIMGAKFNSQFEGANFSVQRILASLNPSKAEMLSGRIDKLRGQIGGQMSTPDQLSGDVSIRFTNGELRGFNLAAAVLKSVRGIPFIDESLTRHLAPELKAKLESDKTKIDLLTTDLTLSGGEIKIRNLLLTSDIFEVTSAGSINKDFNLKLNARITFSAEFSRALVSVAKEIKQLLDESGRFSFPLTIDGQPPKLVVVPDVKSLLKSAGKNLLKDKLGDVLNKSLGKSDKGGADLGKNLKNILGF